MHHACTMRSPESSLRGEMSTGQWDALGDSKIAHAPILSLAPSRGDQPAERLGVHIGGCLRRPGDWRMVLRLPRA